MQRWQMLKHEVDSFFDMRDVGLDEPTVKGSGYETDVGLTGPTVERKGLRQRGSHGDLLYPSAPQGHPQLIS